MKSLEEISGLFVLFRIPALNNGLYPGGVANFNGLRLRSA
jgi:hypothetical protein